MKIYFETKDIPIRRKAELFCELPNHDDYPNTAFSQAIEDLANEQGLMVTESCCEIETPDYSNVDKAKDLLEALLDDSEVSLGNGAGEVVEEAISLLHSVKDS